jgi:hypothetical protein
MELDTTILTDLAATLANPVSLATLIGMLAYALMEILKGFIPKLDKANAWVKRGIVAAIGMGLGLAFTLPVAGGLPVWPQGILAGLVGALVVATARGLGQFAKGKDLKKQGLLALVILMFPLAIACGGLQICKDPTLVLRDGDTAATTTLVFQCGGQDIASQVIPVGELAGFDLCANPSISMKNSTTAGKSNVVIACGGVDLVTFEVDTGALKTSGTTETSITSASVTTTAPPAALGETSSACQIRMIHMTPAQHIDSGR